ncbi:lysoplasmalogenase family protein, partial [Mycobacterium sp.]|uniref:lysoplasmalogenase family protein n=1 Tax=Mycobacterium sp. TaxID=1785 RepID=UPI0031E1EC04
MNASASALLLALAPIVRERRWLMPALLFSAAGDALLAVGWWAASFVFGLGAFLLAHLCFLGALVPLARASRARWIAVALIWLACVGLLRWFWPQLVRDGITIPVTAYISRFVLGTEALAVPIWWTYAAAQVLITAGFFFGRMS